jgi:hypothetical protein
MAAPKTGGMLFRGGPLGGAETRLPDHATFQVKIDRHGRRSRIRPVAGRSLHFTRGA